MEDQVPGLSNVQVRDAVRGPGRSTSEVTDPRVSSLGSEGGQSWSPVQRRRRASRPTPQRWAARGPLMPLILGRPAEEEDKDAVNYGTEKVVCNMSGDSWESLPLPIVVDSGASESVMPES